MKRLTKVSLVALGFSVYWLLIGAGNAQVMMNHPSQCEIDRIGGLGGTAGASLFTLTDVDGSQLVNLGSFSMKAICPVSAPQGGVTFNVRMNVFKNSQDGIIAKGCHTFTFGGGGVCTPAFTNPGTGVQTILFSNFLWNNSHFNYLTFTIGPTISGSSNSFFG